MLKNYSGLKGPLILTLALLAACVDKEQIASIPDAENILITTDHRLIVSGGENIYEIRQDEAPAPLFQLPEELTNCAFSGIAEYNNWLFTSCVSTKFLIFQNKHLLAANLSKSPLTFEILNPPNDSSDPYEEIGLPNGMAFSPDGALLVADSNYFTKSGVARIELDFSGERPRVVRLDKNFVSPEIHGVTNPNGLRVDGNALYLSDGNTVRRFRFANDDSIPEFDLTSPDQNVKNGKVMWSKDQAYVDDIMPYCGGVALTSFLSGRLHYVASYTDETQKEHFPEIYSTPPLAFRGPSSLAYGSIPGVIDSDQLLVTEKGELFELESSFGNQLILSDLTEDLDNPNACHVIQRMAKDIVEG